MDLEVMEKFGINKIVLDEDTTVGSLIQRLDRLTYIYGTEAKITVVEEDGKQHVAVWAKE